MVLKELESNPEMHGKDWSKFLPSSKGASNPQKKERDLAKKKSKAEKKKKKQEAEKRDFEENLERMLPPKSKIDLQIESGEYFMNSNAKDRMKNHKKLQKQKAKMVENAKLKQKRYEAPEEAKRKKLDASKNAKNSEVPTAADLKSKMDP